MNNNYLKKQRTVFTAALLLIFFPLWGAPDSLKAEMLSVYGDKVNLRSGPGKKYIVQWEYGFGFPLVVVKKKGKWIKVKDFEGDSGWVHKNLLADKPRMIVKANRNQEESINIRESPGTKGKVVGKAYYGVVFSTIEQRSGWVKVKHDTGLEGWIKRSLLWGY
jgi:SH3-like domain-containing protein